MLGGEKLVGGWGPGSKAAAWSVRPVIWSAPELRDALEIRGERVMCCSFCALRSQCLFLGLIGIFGGLRECPVEKAMHYK